MWWCYQAVACFDEKKSSFWINLSIDAVQRSGSLRVRYRWGRWWQYLFAYEDDNWVLKCVTKSDGELYYGGDVIELVHENTEKRLRNSRYYEYSYMNWENCPFQGQTEVSAVPNRSRET